ncbi:MAG TPA: radical SAM protein, partial [Deltaproteobacteria bacterium]|nr:radical SAM protein [Deltaproteobacteria bacterium]
MNLIEETMAVVLIHPPVSKPCEPPAGIGRLAGILKLHGIDCTVIDANREILLGCEIDAAAVQDTWTRRAERHCRRHMSLLTQWSGYTDHARYTRAVSDINRVLDAAAKPAGASVSLADYQGGGLNPVRSSDLLRSAEQPERNPFYPYFSRRLAGVLDQIGPDLIGFSLNYLSQALCTFAMMGLLRRLDPRARIVLGGSLVTSWTSRQGRIPRFAGLVDAVVSGPGEEPLVRLAGGWPATGRCLPDYACLFEAPYLAPGPILPYSASSGCYWNRCTFCPERLEASGYAGRPPGEVIHELETLIERSDPILIHLLDNALSPALLKALADHPLSAPWYGFARVTGELADPDFCRALRRSGCVMLQLGLESGDQGVLDALDKGIRLEDVRKALANLKASGVATYAYLLFGTPAENRASAVRTMAFVRENAHLLDYLNLAVFNLPVASPEALSLDSF